jgi:hypothetical protein
VRKAIYRLVKDGPASVRWYEWFFAGNEDWGYAQLDRLAAYVREHGIRLSVVILPSVYAYEGDDYLLADMQGKVVAHIESLGIPALDPTADFADDPPRYIDPTDHLYDPGSQRMAESMLRLLRSEDVERARVSVPERP